VRYFATASTQRVRDVMRQGLLGQIVTPAAGNRLEPGVEWIGDNSVFGGKYPGDSAYLDWLDTHTEAAEYCRFVVAPDVVCDAAATFERSAPMLDPIRSIGYPVAYVAQNGATPTNLPWGRFDALFLGGDTAWKLGREARDLVAEARDRGVWTHMGRVNSRQRLVYAAVIGCDSVDGTYLAYGPDTNLPKLLGWLRHIDQPALFTGGAA
jgi:hypothetical protein